MVRSLLAWLHATFTTAVIFSYVGLTGPFFILHAWLTGNIRPLYRCAQLGCRLGMLLAGMRVKMAGRENLSRGGRVIYMCNHLSNVEPPVLFAVLPYRIAFMAKHQLFRIPVLGTAMRLGGFVPVVREDPEEAKASVEVALETLRTISFLVFPEGTRSRDGTLQRFRRGVFHLAIRGAVPIVPLTVEGADAIMRKGRWQLYPGTLRITVHPAVETEGRRLEERGRLAEEVRIAIASALPPERRGGA